MQRDSRISGKMPAARRDGQGWEAVHSQTECPTSRWPMPARAGACRDASWPRSWVLPGGMGGRRGRTRLRGALRALLCDGAAVAVLLSCTSPTATETARVHVQVLPGQGMPSRTGRLAGVHLPCRRSEWPIAASIPTSTLPGAGPAVTLPVLPDVRVLVRPRVAVPTRLRLGCRGSRRPALGKVARTNAEAVSADLHHADLATPVVRERPHHGLDSARSTADRDPAAASPDVSRPHETPPRRCDVPPQVFRDQPPVSEIRRVRTGLRGLLRQHGSLPAVGHASTLVELPATQPVAGLARPLPRRPDPHVRRVLEIVPTLAPRLPRRTRSTRCHRHRDPQVLQTHACPVATPVLDPGTPRNRTVH